MDPHSRERSTFSAVALPLATLLGGLIFTYLIGFAFLVLDTFLMNDTVWMLLPDPLQEVLEVIYWPLIKLVRIFV